LSAVRVGVIGVGHQGKHHARAYTQLEEANLVGVYDADPARTMEVASQFAVQAFDSEARLLKQVEAVSVVVPTSSHAEVGVRALEHGVHTFVEKPIASTLAEAGGLVQAAQQRGLVLQVGHIERFNQAVRALSGEPLAPRFVEAHRLAQFSPRGTDVAVVLDLMIHDIDLILWMVKSKPVSIDAVGVAVVSDSADIANARLTFENGCVANVTASRISPKKMRKMRLFQQNAYVSLDLASGLAEVYRLSGEGSSQQRAASLGELEWGREDRGTTYEQLQAAPGDALELELGAFLGSVRAKTRPPVTGEEAREALAVALEVMTAIEARSQEAK